jgi:hypothetical protein
MTNSIILDIEDMLIYASNEGKQDNHVKGSFGKISEVGLGYIS